jgi:outer membrane protein assembly factor BamD (BamD/ComL family)
MAEVKETLAEHEWIVARFYARNRRWLAVRARLEYLKEHYPEYSGMDQVDDVLAQARDEIAKFQAMIDKLQEETPDEEGAEDSEAPGITDR